MGKKIILVLTFVLFMFVLFNNYKIKSPSRTFMIYMNGSDLESDEKIASKDIQEILNSNIPKNYNVLIYTGGTKNWHNENINEKYNQLFEIKNGEMKLVKNFTKKSMGDSETLEEFLNFSLSKYKAKENIFIFWNHGGGSLSGFGKDENFKSDTLLISEMQKGFKEAYRKNKIKLDLISFDACLMGAVEVAYKIADYGKYMVGSEEFVYSYGFDYNKILEKSVNMNIECIGRLFVESYYKEGILRGKDDMISMSLIDLQKAKNLYLRFNKILSYDKYSSNFENIKLKKDDMIIFGGKTQAEGFSNMVDFKSMIDVIINKKDRSKLNQYVDDAVIFKLNGEMNKKACGLSIFFPVYNSFNTNKEMNLYSYMENNNYYCKLLNNNIVKNIEKFYENDYSQNSVFSKKNETIYGKNENNSKENTFFLEGYELKFDKIGKVGNSELLSGSILYNGMNASLRFLHNKYTKECRICGIVIGKGKWNISEKKLIFPTNGDIISVLYYGKNNQNSSKITKVNVIKVTKRLKILQM